MNSESYPPDDPVPECPGRARDLALSRRSAMGIGLSSAALLASWGIVNPSQKARAAVEYVYPSSGRQVSDDFQAHLRRSSVNPGTDYVLGIGTPLVAVRAGRIVLAQTTFGGSGGRIVGIDHGDRIGTQYLHLSRVDVRVGDSVAQGQGIGLSGASANGSERGVGPHLHIALKVNDRNVDFEKYVGVSTTPAPPAIITEDGIVSYTINNTATGGIYTVAPQFIKHEPSTSSAQLAAAVTTMDDTIIKLDGSQFLTFLDSLGIPRNVVPSNGAIWSREVDIVAKLDQLLAR
jgi:murein DD-endopeptidase MepM/ murein hydrolase activator NlpD